MAADDARDGNILINSAMYGVISVLPLLSILDKVTITQIEIAAYLFSAAILTSAVSTFIASNIRGRSLKRSTQDALWSMLLFFVGGCVPFLIGTLIDKRIMRDLFLFGVSTLIIALILTADFLRKKGNQPPPHARTYWILGACIVLPLAVIVFFADQAKHLRSSISSAGTFVLA